MGEFIIDLMGSIVMDLLNNGGKIDEFIHVINGKSFVGNAKLKHGIFRKNKTIIVIKLKKDV